MTRRVATRAAPRIGASWGHQGRVPGLRQELLRRKPVRSHGGQHAAGEHGEHLPRSIGTFQLMMFGVGATVGTGIFFVMHEAVPDAGPAVIMSFVLAGLAAGLAASATPRWRRRCRCRVDLLLRLRDARRGRRDGRRGVPAAGVRRLDGGGRGRLERLPQRAAAQPLRLEIRTRSSPRRRGTPSPASSTCPPSSSSRCACSC